MSARDNNAVTYLDSTGAFLSGLMFDWDGRVFDVRLDKPTGLAFTRIARQLELSETDVAQVILAVIKAERGAA